MVEKRLFCKKCQWIPQSKDEQSIICPKCGNECTLGDVILKEDFQAWQDDLADNSKHKFKKL